MEQRETTRFDGFREGGATGQKVGGGIKIVSLCFRRCQMVLWDSGRGRRGPLEQDRSRELQRLYKNIDTNKYEDMRRIGGTKMLEKGLIQIYTGDGKGKTTAAVGQAIRAIGHGMKVGLVYFHKFPSKWGYWELKVLDELGVKIRGFAKKHPHFFKEITQDRMRKECLKGVKFIEKIFEEKSCDMLLLDEIIISLRDGYLREEEILELLEKKPEDMEVILTGRGATENLIEKADLVSEVRKIKHPFDEGVKSRPGIEF